MMKLNGTCERAAFNTGIKVVRQMALTTAVTIEVRGAAGRARNQASVAALQAFAEGTQYLVLQATCAPKCCISAVVYSGLDAGIGQEAKP